MRLPEVRIENVLALLNEPRNARHMPLARAFARAEAAEWVREKDAQWIEHGIGPWAVLVDGVFAGWWGSETEGTGADFALVLRPDYWGWGTTVMGQALEKGFRSLGLDRVTISLPLTRNPHWVVTRCGFEPDGLTTHEGESFRRYLLLREEWERLWTRRGPRSHDR